MTARLDRVAERLTRERPGLRLTRADAMRIALERGLALLGEEGSS